MKQIVVYVAGPVSNGGKETDDSVVEKNVHDAIFIADVLMNNDLFPLVPHLIYYWHREMPRDYDDWIELGLALLKKCDVLYRMPGTSLGADLEAQKAREWNIPVFNDLISLSRWARKKNEKRRRP